MPVTTVASTIQEHNAGPDTAMLDPAGTFPVPPRLRGTDRDHHRLRRVVPGTGATWAHWLRAVGSD